MVPKMHFWSGLESKKQELRHREHPYTHTEGVNDDQLQNQHSTARVLITDSPNRNPNRI